jgi:tRNA modification GTPase
MLQAVDTIYALSTGGLPSGVAVIRVSGVAAGEVVLQLCGRLPIERKATLQTIRSRDGHVIDQGLVLWFVGPKTFTGEDCAEFHIHGGKAVVAALLDELGRFPGLRAALAGEFSQRAFENGKLDLVQIEGLSDLLSAETEMQRRLAIEQSGAGTTQRYQAWADRLTFARAMIEAELDFSDEGDVPGSVSDQVWMDMERLTHEMTSVISGHHMGEIVRDGLKVVIAGRPNSGKSSLLNAIASRDLAIVSEVPGTTRDVLSVDVNLDGFLVRFYDTAGMRETTDAIESEGIRRAQLAVEQADIVLWLSCDQEVTSPEVAADESRKLYHIRTKSDLFDIVDPAQFDLSVSVKTGEGIDSLLKLIHANLVQSFESLGSMIVARDRQIGLLRECSANIRFATDLKTADLAVRSEYLRLAADCIGRITGKIDADMLLGHIFSRFCIGK